MRGRSWAPLSLRNRAMSARRSRWGLRHPAAFGARHRHGGLQDVRRRPRGRGPRALEQAVGGVVARANRTPGLVQVFTLFNTSTPEVYADIDRTKAEMLGVRISRFFLPTQCILRKAIRPGASSRAPGRPGVVRDPGMGRRSLRGNREISRSTVRQKPPVRIGAKGRGQGERAPAKHAPDTVPKTRVTSAGARVAKRAL
jgi:hypothetical protein